MRDKLIQVRVNEMELEMAQRLAAAEQRSIASMIRRLISLEVDKYQALKDASHGN